MLSCQLGNYRVSWVAKKLKELGSSFAGLGFLHYVPRFPQRVAGNSSWGSIVMVASWLVDQLPMSLVSQREGVDSQLSRCMNKAM